MSFQSSKDIKSLHALPESILQEEISPSISNYYSEEADIISQPPLNFKSLEK